MPDYIEQIFLLQASSACFLPIPLLPNSSHIKEFVLYIVEVLVSNSVEYILYCTGAAGTVYSNYTVCNAHNVKALVSYIAKVLH